MITAENKYIYQKTKWKNSKNIRKSIHKKTPLSCEKLSDVFVHGIENQASSKSSKEAQYFPTGSIQEQDT